MWVAPCFSHIGNIILTGRGRQYTLRPLELFHWMEYMIPNRIVRYFMFLGYALGHGGCTPFPTFQNGVTQFYFEYLHQQYFLTQPAYYPKNYGVN